MINSISFSGGRTSAYLSHLAKTGSMTGKVEFLYSDTGAEHPLTYQFIKQVDDFLNLNLVAIKAVVDQELGKSNDYQVVTVDSLKWDLKIMRAITKKYGGFTNNRPYCTDKLKTIISDKYRNEKHSKEGFYTWLGIRYDEPKRLVGAKAYGQLIKQGFEQEQISEMFVDIAKNIDTLDSVTYAFVQDETKELLKKQRAKQNRLNLRYMAEISKATKQDVLDWWAKQPFDLQIDEHKGNCVFCIKKSDLKLTIAAREEPELFNDWCSMVHSDDVRLMPADKFGKGRIYRKWLSPEMVIAQFSGSTTEELRERAYKTKQFDTGSCSESCEAFSDLDQLDLFTDGAA